MMSDPQSIDGVLVQWGERLFYPGNRIVKVAPQPKLPANLLRQRADAVRARIKATVVRRAPQVMVKVVRADLNLTHPTDLNLTRGWAPALQLPAVDNCSSFLLSLAGSDWWCDAGEDAKGVARSGFPRARRSRHPGSACGSDAGNLFALRSFSRALMRRFELAVAWVTR